MASMTSIRSADSEADLLMKGGDSGHDSPQEEGDTLRQEPKLVETTAESVDVH